MSTAVRPGYKVTEVGVIPEDWEVRPVSAVGEVLTGKALAVNGPGKQRAYLRTKNVFDGRIDVDDVLTMPMTETDFRQFEVQRNDLLLNEGQSLELVGRCARYGGEYESPCAMQNQLIRFRVAAETSPLFAEQLFRHCQHTGVFARIALKTTSIAHLGGKRFGQLLLAWPRSLDEQHRVGAALCDADAAIDHYDRLLTKKRDLKQAAMQELLTGKRRLPGFSGEWKRRRLGDIADVQRGASPRPISDPVWFEPNSPIGWVRISDISSSRIFLSETAQTLSPAGVAKSRFIKAHNLIMSICATVGRPVITKLDTCIHDGFVVFENLQADLIFMYYLLKTLEPNWTRSGQTGSQTNVNTSLVKGALLTLPTLVEQAAITSVLFDMDAEIEALEHRQNKTKLMKQGMMQELLTGRTRLI